MNPTATAVRPTVDLKAIETRGFAVIRNFLNQEELNILLNDYNESKNRAQNANYPITYLGPEVFPLLREKIMELSEAVGKVTSTCVDSDQGGIYFSVKKGIKFDWHQDHESFFMNQNHTDYLNFYTIILKEKPEEANLHVIPFDKFKAKSPEYFERVVGGGAIRYEVHNNETRIISDETGKKIGTLPYDIGTLAETPQLNAGDLLLLRGDLIHSTQIADSARVALSVRMANSKNRISLKKMVNGSKAKRITMTNNRQVYTKIFNAFEQLNAVESTYSELIAKFNLDQSPAPSKFKFLLRLFKLRLQLIFQS